MSMAVPRSFLFHQFPAIIMLLKTALRSGKSPSRVSPPVTPGPKYYTLLQAPEKKLIEAYIKYLGADPQRYEEILPFHFFLPGDF